MISLILTFILISIVIRLVTLPFRIGRRFNRWSGFGYGYGYNPYRYGCRRHHRVLGGILPIVALVALDRLFLRRY
jgi:hypothetical protein